jgi:hypothetical protein
MEGEAYGQPVGPDHLACQRIHERVGTASAG